MVEGGADPPEMGEGDLNLSKAIRHKRSRRACNTSVEGGGGGLCSCSPRTNTHLPPDPPLDSAPYTLGDKTRIFHIKTKLGFVF